MRVLKKTMNTIIQLKGNNIDAVMIAKIKKGCFNNKLNHVSNNILVTRFLHHGIVLQAVGSIELKPSLTNDLVATQFRFNGLHF